MSETLTQERPSAGATRRPLNILEIASHFPGWGGTEIHILNLSEQLVKRGHRVTVVCRPGHFVEEQARTRGLRTVAATVVKQQDWTDRRVFWRLMHEERFDIAHAHWRPDYVVAPTIARLSGVPVVLMSHHSPYPLKKKEQIAFPHLYNRMIALSESVRRMLLGLGLPPDKVVTIHHGTDTDAFRQVTLPAQAVRAEWGVRPNEFLVGMAGRLSREKGVDDFLHAIGSLADLPVRGVLIGDGPQKEELMEMARSLGLADRVIFAGFRNDVNNAINALDALVLASTWAEPCAAVIQQAMALEKPVIGTTMGGTPEMIAGDETGLLVPPSDAAALAGAMRTLATDPALCRTMGSKGRVRAEERFTLAGMTDKIEDLYYRECSLKRKL